MTQQQETISPFLKDLLARHLPNPAEVEGEPISQADFEEDELKVHADFYPLCHVRLTVDVPPSWAKRVHPEALAKTRKEARLPGFRKGRVPDELLIKQFSAEVRSNWWNEVIQQAGTHSLKVANLIPQKQSLELKKADGELDKGIQLELSLYKIPDSLDEESIKALQVERVAAEPVTEEQIDKYMHNLRRLYATWEELEARPLEKGDYATLSGEATDGKEPKTFFTEERFHIDDEQMPQWLQEAVIGHNPGEVCETETAYELEDPTKKELFEPRSCKITIHKLEKIILPEIDDEFAKSRGAETVDDLRKRITINLEHGAEDRAYNQMMAQVEKMIGEQLDITAPYPPLLEEFKEAFHNKLAQARAAGIVGAETAVESIEESVLEPILKEALVSARQALAINWVALHLCSEKQLTIDPEEVKQAYAMEMLGGGQGNSHLAYLATPEQRASAVYHKIQLQRWLAAIVEALLAKAETPQNT